jgi:acetyl-CoA synthetase
MSDPTVHPVPAEWKSSAYIDNDRYLAMYKRSVDDPEGFWREHGQRIDWIKPFTKVKNVSYKAPDVSIKWFEDGSLNVSANCIDRHLATRGDQVAILWEPDDPAGAVRSLTYRQLHREVGIFANVLKKMGVKKGDRVTIYLPMIPETAVAMLACARIGAVHSVVFAGFSPDSLAGRIDDCRSDLVITADWGLRGGRKVPLKHNTDEALMKSLGDERVIVVRHTGDECAMQAGRDFWYHDLAEGVSADCPAEEMNAEDPLFILYTSGSTGKPKGVLHTTGGYLVWTSLTHQLVFDYHDGDIYWCAADVGWVTGHSYIVYGPLANGATTVMFESTPSYPDPEVVDRLIEEHRSRWSVGLARGSPAGRIMLPACVKGEDSRSWRWISSHRQLRS